MIPARSYAELLANFGNPGPFLRADGTIDPTWELHALAVISLPAPIRLGFVPPGMLEAPMVERVRCNKAVAANLQEVYNAIHDEGLWPSLKTFDGCYAWRRQRGSITRPSFHCWGLAVDHNAFEDPQGDAVIDMDGRVVQVFKRYGWSWGGDFKGNRVDAEHFQFADFAL